MKTTDVLFMGMKATWSSTGTISTFSCFFKYRATTANVPFTKPQKAKRPKGVFNVAIIPDASKGLTLEPML